MCGQQKEQTELKATNIISLFHPKKKIIIFFKKAGRHFGFLKKAGHRALQKRPRQNTDTSCGDTVKSRLDAGKSPIFRSQSPCTYTYRSRNGFGILYVILRTVVARG